MHLTALLHSRLPDDRDVLERFSWLVLDICSPGGAGQVTGRSRSVTA